jgi:hypothetical protein
VAEATPSVPVHRGILAAGLEQSTSALRTNPIKEELRQEVYSMLEASMIAGVRAAHCDPFADRGDGVLALIDPLSPLRAPAAEPGPPHDIRHGRLWMTGRCHRRQLGLALET